MPTIVPITTTSARCWLNEAPALLNGALSGKFTINEDGDQVCFSRGNMYWEGDSFEFEANQYDYSTALSASHVSHLYWSKYKFVAYAASYSESSTSDVFFTNATETTAKSDFTVNGVRGRYRTLSNDEWVYVFTKHGKNLANPSASSQTLNNKHYL